MKSTDEVHAETSQVLADAVAEVTRRVLTPELLPFQTKIDDASKRLSSSADLLHIEIRADQKALRDATTKLNQVIELGDGQANSVNQSLQQMQGVKTRIDSLASQVLEDLERQEDRQTKVLAQVSASLAALVETEKEQNGTIDSTISELRRLSTTLGKLGDELHMNRTQQIDTLDVLREVREDIHEWTTASRTLSQQSIELLRDVKSLTSAVHDQNADFERRAAEVRQGWQQESNEFLQRLEVAREKVAVCAQQLERVDPQQIDALRTQFGGLVNQQSQEQGQLQQRIELGAARQLRLLIVNTVLTVLALTAAGATVMWMTLR